MDWELGMNSADLEKEKLKQIVLGQGFHAKIILMNTWHKSSEKGIWNR